MDITSLFGKRKKRILDLLREGEKLSSKELEREDTLAKFLQYFNEFLQESRGEKIQAELRKDYIDIQTKDVLEPYFNRILSILKRILVVLSIMNKSNKKILENVTELKEFVDKYNSSKWNFIPTAQRSYFLEFQKTCNKRYEERTSIHNILVEVIVRIESMIKVIERGLEDINNINARHILEYLNTEKQILLEVLKVELSKLGFEVDDLKDIMELEELNQVIFDKEFLSMTKRGRKIITWNKRLKRILLTYTSLYYIGYQIVLPAYFTAMYIPTKSTVAIYNQEVYERLKQYSNKINFRSSDGIELSGTLVKNRANATTNEIMVFIHGRSSNETGLLPYIEKLRLLTENVDFFTINLREHGPDTADKWLRRTTLGLREAFDVVGAINRMAELGYEKAVVYGHSIGGAAVINAVGTNPNLISKKIEIKGVIVEKTFANFYDFAWRNHKLLFSDLFGNIRAGLGARTQYTKPIVQPSYLQSVATQNLIEKLSSFKFSENNPSKAIKNINAPVMIIGVKEGDSYMTPEDAETLVKNAKHGIKIEVSEPDVDLATRHSPEFNNSYIIANIVKFITQVLK